MPRFVANKTSLHLLAPEQPIPPRRTYVTLGLERGGTSAVAGMQRALGLHLGDNMAGNNEDPAFHAKTLPQLRNAIEQRNERHDVWGWKYPTAAQNLPALLPTLRNPYFVIVYRDVVSTALSRHKWDGASLRRRLDLAVHEANVWTNLNVSFALASRRPCLLISHEKMLLDNSATIDEIAGFLGVEIPDDEHRAKMLAYLAPGQYKKFEDFFGETPLTMQPAATTPGERGGV